jgi:hypothetical protein
MSNRNFLVVDPTGMVIWGRYASMGRAERALLNVFEKGTRLNGRRCSVPFEVADNLVIMTREEFRENDREVEVKNMMTGAMVKIRESQRGGPCDPSTELYWSM